MDPASCRVIYIDDRFAAEKWLTRDMVGPSLSSNNRPSQALSSDVAELPSDLQKNVHAMLAIFNQVFVCNSGRSFSVKLAETHESVKPDCSPIFALFDVDSDSSHDHRHKIEGQKLKSQSKESAHARPSLQRQMTFSSEADECYGLELLSRISCDLQVSEGTRLIIPVALVRMARKDSTTTSQSPPRASFAGNGSRPYSNCDDSLSPIDSRMMLQCLDAGALDVILSPLNHEKIMGLTVHAYRIYKTAKNEQSAFLASASRVATAARRRQQSWVGIQEEKPYAYLREAMVKKLLKGICEPETAIEDSQHGELFVQAERKQVIAAEIGKWTFCGHDFSEDELVYAGHCMLSHALSMPDLEPWRMSQDEILRFMQASRVAYNSFVLYHNFRHAVDVMQSLFYFLIQIGTVPPYPVGSSPPPLSQDKSPIARLLFPFEALTLLVSAVGHDVGHPGVNNMFLVKLNAPLAQLYNDQSVLEAFHCAAFSQILRRHWPSVFADKSMRRLLISSILATDMGVHSEYMQQLGNLQEKIHECKTTDTWTPKDADSFRVLICGLLIKCADISNVARPWTVAEKWTHLLQQEFASQGEMEKHVGMETTLFGGPPEIGNVMKLANGQVGFMTIFAHPLFANVTDIIPAMGFAAAEIAANKSVWMTKIEQEKRKEQLRAPESFHDGAVSPRSQSPPRKKSHYLTGAESPRKGYFHASSLRQASSPQSPLQEHNNNHPEASTDSQFNATTTEKLQNPRTRTSPAEEVPINSSKTGANEEGIQSSSGVFPNIKPQSEAKRPDVQVRRSSNSMPRSLQMNGIKGSHHESTTTMTMAGTSGLNQDGDKIENELRKRNLSVVADSSTYNGSVQRTLLGPRRPDEGRLNAEVPLISEPVLPNSTSSLASGHPFSQIQSPAQSSGLVSISSTTDPSSMATHAFQTSATTVSSNTPSPAVPTTLVNGESLGQSVDDLANNSGLQSTKRDVDHNRVKSSPGVLEKAATPTTMDGAKATISSGEQGTRNKSTVTASAAPLKESEQESESAYEGEEGEKGVRKRMDRLKFWKKRINDDER